MSLRNAFVTPGLMAPVLALAVSGCSFPNKTATSTAAMASGNFSSGETLEVLRTLNNGEIAQAELAMDKTDNESVRDVADLIIDDHTEVNERVNDLVMKGIEPEKSPLSRGLGSQAQRVQDKLANIAGSEFDCMFLKKQVEQHQIAIETLRGQVMPDADDPQIETLLEDTVAALETHREKAAKAHANMEECEQY